MGLAVGAWRQNGRCAGRILLAALTALLCILPAQAATQQDSFQVRAFVVASCALPAFSHLPQGFTGFSCLHAPSLSAILPQPPRMILDRDGAAGGPLLTVEF